MILEKITIEEILERYTTLPDEILYVLEDPNIEDIIKNICERNNISRIDWIETIKQLTAAVLLGFIHYYDLGAEINLALNSSNSKLGNDIAKEIELKVFANIKSLLEKNYSPPKIKDPIDIINEKLIENSKIKTSSPTPQSDSVDESAVKVAADNKIHPPLPTNQTPTPEHLSPKMIFDFYQKNNQKNPEVFKTTPPQIFQKNISTPQSPPPIPKYSQNEKQVSPSNIPKELKSPPSPATHQQIPQTPSRLNPVFIYKEEKVIPIKSGIEIPSKDIEISKVKTPPPPPKPAEIEIGTKNLESNSKIKIVNYSEEQPQKSSNNL